MRVNVPPFSSGKNDINISGEKEGVAQAAASVKQLYQAAVREGKEGGREREGGRGREREGGRERERGREGEGGREREGVHVCVGYWPLTPSIGFCVFKEPATLKWHSSSLNHSPNILY